LGNFAYQQSNQLTTIIINKLPKNTFLSHINLQKLTKKLDRNLKFLPFFSPFPLI
jgi:hypothetical protein